MLDVQRIADQRDASGRTELSAAFARYRGLEAGAVLEVLGSRSPAAIGACTFVGADDRIGDAASIEWGVERGALAERAVQRAEVELLDVGTIEVRVAGSEASLAPRAFPDIASVIAGVWYASDAELAVPRADVDEYTFRASGSAEVPAFDAIVLAPADPGDVRLDGVPLAEALAAIREAGLEVSWAAIDPRDLVEIEIRSGGDVLACAARDSGAFRIEPQSLATLAPDPAATLAVRRVRLSPVDVPGLDDAFARISVSRELEIELR